MHRLADLYVMLMRTIRGKRMESGEKVRLDKVLDKERMTEGSYVIQEWLEKTNMNEAEIVFLLLSFCVQFVKEKEHITQFIEITWDAKQQADAQR